MVENSDSKSEKTPASMPKSDQFSKNFYFIVPIIIPLVVTFGTFLFYPVCPHQFIWVPILLIYWSMIWAFSLVYHKKKGSVFTKERFEFTVKLKGKTLWLQYLLTYGPIIYALPLFIINYAFKLSPLMYLLIIVAAIINGPSEEVFWRSCMDEAGKNAGYSEKSRLIYAPIAFAFWHTAFVIHIYPWDNTWFLAWGGILLMTWSSGIIWLWVMHRSGRLIPQCIYHSCANFLNIFPMVIITILHLYL